MQFLIFFIMENKEDKLSNRNKSKYHFIYLYDVVSLHK